MIKGWRRYKFVVEKKKQNNFLFLFLFKLLILFIYTQAVAIEESLGVSVIRHKEKVRNEYEGKEPQTKKTEKKKIKKNQT